MVRGGLVGGWLSRSSNIRSSQLGRSTDRIAEEADSPVAVGVGVRVGMGAGRLEVAGVGEGVATAVGNGGTVAATGATMVETALGPQARLSAAIAERINVRMNGVRDDLMNDFIVSFSHLRPGKIGTESGVV